MKRRMPELLFAAALVSLSPTSVLADIDPNCDADENGLVDGFDAAQTSNAAQEWNLAAATALNMAPSPMTSPAPYKAFKVAVGMDFYQFDYLTCQERTVLIGGNQKTEDTNKTPIVPRFRVSLGLPFSYITLSGLPPLTLFGVRTGVITGEVGAGYRIPVIGLKPGVRVHVSGGQIVGDIAHPFGYSPGDEGYEEAAVDDEYQFLNYGADLSLAWEINLPVVDIAPYIGGGFLKAQSIFFVGEDDYTVFLGEHFQKYLHEENPGPDGGPYPGYSGLNAFAGVRVEVIERIEGTLEGYFIPVRMALNSDDRFATASGSKSEYVTNFISVRARVGYIF